MTLIKHKRATQSWEGTRENWRYEVSSLAATPRRDEILVTQWGFIPADLRSWGADAVRYIKVSNVEIFLFLNCLLLPARVSRSLMETQVCSP